MTSSVDTGINRRVDAEHWSKSPSRMPSPGTGSRARSNLGKRKTEFGALGLGTRRKYTALGVLGVSRTFLHLGANVSWLALSVIHYRRFKRLAHSSVVS
jgi:hypothetical protein